MTNPQQNIPKSTAFRPSSQCWFQPQATQPKHDSRVEGESIVVVSENYNSPDLSDGIDAVPRSVRTKIRRLHRLAKLMDSAFVVPGTRWRLGLDSLVGLIPGVGDMATVVVSAVIIQKAIQAGVSKATTAKMILNVGVDFLVGVVPIVGDLFDVGFKSNLKNVQLMEVDLIDQHTRERHSVVNYLKKRHSV